ncbi:hypothetical protein [Mycoplasma struthionis]|uniref:Uncharacterized protein n=1 Tax=Mycoplasma struthionis TaxID=538220 RepID=A0A502M448_9MOLU|nr:hypothetical protein [Mycoplasma struthionis]TPI02387.1 hypothetical protein FJM01_00875 [Mycoplasma struthionis]
MVIVVYIALSLILSGIVYAIFNKKYRVLFLKEIAVNLWDWIKTRLNKIDSCVEQGVSWGWIPFVGLLVALVSLCRTSEFIKRIKMENIEKITQ